MHVRRQIRVHQHLFSPTFTKGGAFWWDLWKKSQEVPCHCCLRYCGRWKNCWWSLSPLYQTETALWCGESTAQNNTMHVGASEGKALLSVSPISYVLPWHQAFNLIHVFISFPRDSNFQLETRSEFVPCKKLWVTWWKVTNFSVRAEQGSVEPLCNLLTKRQIEPKPCEPKPQFNYL